MYKIIDRYFISYSIVTLQLTVLTVEHKMKCLWFIVFLEIYLTQASIKCGDNSGEMTTSLIHCYIAMDHIMQMCILVSLK